MGENFLMMLLEALIAFFVIVGMIGIRKEKNRKKSIKILLYSIKQPVPCRFWQGTGVLRAI